MTAQQTALRVWYDESNYVIAASEDDARKVLMEHVGEVCDDDFGVVDGRQRIAIWCDSKGDPDEPGGPGVSLVKKTAAEWALRGRGFLCSEDF